jgi:hypothetical protein
MNCDMKHKINDKLRSIKDKHILWCIFNICKEDLISAGKRRYSCNDSGVFYNLHHVSNGNLLIINDIIDAHLLNLKDDDEIEV